MDPWMGLVNRITMRIIYRLYTQEVVIEDGTLDGMSVRHNLRAINYLENNVFCSFPLFWVGFAPRPGGQMCFHVLPPELLALLTEHIAPSRADPVVVF